MGFLWFLFGWFWFFLKLECCILEAFPFKISLQMVAQLWNPNPAVCLLKSRTWKNNGMEQSPIHHLFYFKYIKTY